MGRNYNSEFKKKFDGKYTIGLDIGTSSVGWAVINENFHSPVYKGTKSMGTRIFPAAKTAEGTRIKRGMRRRIRKRKHRIKFLQEIFTDALENEYPGFLRAVTELEKPATVSEELNYKRQLTGLSLQKVLEIIDPSKEILTDFPTMYHLRKELIENPEQMDLRLVYLALHHIVRKRGNFLQEGIQFSELGENNVAVVQELIEEIYNTNHDDQLELQEGNIEEFLQIIKQDDTTKSDRKNNIKKLNKKLEEFGKLLLDMKVNLSIIFPSAFIDDKTTYKITDEDIEDKLSERLTDEQFNQFLELKKVYLNIMHADVMQGEDYLSVAKVNSYNQYRADLLLLKEAVSDNKEYKYKLIKSSDKSLSNWKNTRKADTRCLVDKYQSNSITGQGSQVELFYNALRKDLKALKEKSPHKTSVIEVILNKIDLGTFMEKLNTTKNSAIPYQLNSLEATKIMENQAVFYPQLFTQEMQQRIISIIEFRVPYYIGPLTDKGDKVSRFSWMTKKNDEPIRPWNFTEVVDEVQSAETFIRKMTGKCTYLLGGKNEVLPKQSLVYQLYEVLNEINKIKINDQPISKEQRNSLLDGLFLVNKKVSVKKAEQHLQKNYGTVKISGTQQENHFATSLSSWIEMMRIFDKPVTIKDVVNPTNDELESQKNMMENFVLWSTVFPEGNIYQQKIESVYPEIDSKLLQRALQLKTTGWGRLSQKLLLGVPPQNARHMQSCVLDILLYGDEQNRLYNLQQVLTHPKYNIEKNIKLINGEAKSGNKIVYDDIKELAGSPALKRGIWEAISIIEDIESIFGKPKNIVIETAKSDEGSYRPKSRANQAADILSGLENDRIKEEFATVARDFNNDRIWLYLLQAGKCMYTGKPLNIDRLHTYQIDHIIPYSLINDNNIDNKVLVIAQANQDKSNYLMPLELMNKQQASEMKRFWYQLKEQKLLSAKKLARLLKPTLTDDMAEGFINRQLVETRQITKHVITLLEQKYGETVQVVGLKATFNDTIKRNLGIVKIRELNNLHHAVDAYMAAFIYQYALLKNKDDIVDGKMHWHSYIHKYRKADRYSNTLKSNWLAQEMQTDSTMPWENVYQFICRQIDDTRIRVTRKVGNFGKGDSDKELWQQTLVPIVMEEKKKQKFDGMYPQIGKQYLGRKTKVQPENVAFISYVDSNGIKQSAMISIPLYLYKQLNEDVEKCIRVILHDTLGESQEITIIYLFEKNQTFILDDIPCRFISNTERSQVIELLLPQRIQKLFQTRMSKDLSLEQNIELIRVNQITFLEQFRENAIKILESYYKEIKVQLLIQSINRYISLLEDMTNENLINQMGLINTTVLGASTKKEDKKTNKKISIDDKFEPKQLTDLAAIFDKYCVRYLFKVLKADSANVPTWSWLGKIVTGIKVEETDSLIVLEQSPTGLHTKKITLIKNGKIGWESNGI